MNKEKLIYRTFTIADLEDWLIHNVDNGLSDAIIARPRAYAFINNPHARKDDVVIAAVFDGDRAIGYTAAYAEKWVRPALQDRYFWGSTQWLEPEYRGKGASWNMMRQIKDAANDKYIALDSTVASCRLDQKQGSRILYYPRYFYVLDNMQTSFRSLFKRVWVKHKNQRALKAIRQIRFQNKYVNFIDDKTYKFITTHSGNDLFLRSRDFLNWQLQYPFIIPVAQDSHIMKDTCQFSAYAHTRYHCCVQVWDNISLVGFYVLHFHNGVCTIAYLYYESSKQEYVFASVISTMFYWHVVKIQTFNKDIVAFWKENNFQNINSKHCIDQISLTIPQEFDVDEDLCIQGADGDMFI